MPFIKPSFRDTKLGWYASHRGHINNIIRGQAKVILLGDSLVANLSRYPSVWDHYLKPLNAVNCGIGGDRTQHALWQADNIYLPDSVYVAVIHCGTNNMDCNVYQPYDIAFSVISCGSRLRERNPLLKVVVAGILPRDPIASKRRSKIQQTNEILKQLCWKEGFVFIGQDSHWLTNSGNIHQSLYWKDGLHLNREGCKKLASLIATSVISLTPSPTTTTSSPTPTTPVSYTHLTLPTNREV